MACLLSLPNFFRKMRPYSLKKAELVEESKYKSRCRFWVDCSPSVVSHVTMLGRQEKSMLRVSSSPCSLEPETVDVPLSSPFSTSLLQSSASVTRRCLESERVSMSNEQARAGFTLIHVQIVCAWHSPQRGELVQRIVPPLSARSDTAVQKASLTEARQRAR